MEYIFTEGDYTGDFRFGGELTIKAETAVEVESLIKHFRLFSDVSDVETLKARIAALESSTLAHVIKSDKRPVYEVNGCLEYDFTEPYKKWALRDFGFDGVFPDLEIPRKWDGLIHTNYQSRLYTESEHICFNAYVSAKPWNKKEAQVYAESLVTDYIGEEFGTRRNEPEFIQSRNGHYVKNPNYLRRHRPTPAASNARLKRAFFQWWLATHANAAQKTVYDGNQEIARNASYMSAFEFERASDTIYYEHTGNDYKAMSFPEFAALESK